MLGQLRDIRARPLDFLVAAARAHGDLVKLPIGRVHVYIVNHPDAVAHVLQQHPQNVTKRTLQFTGLARVTGNGLLTSDGPFWLRQRRLVQPAFHRGRIHGLAGQMTASIAALVERWSSRPPDAGPIDVDQAMLGLALEIVTRSLFSTDLAAEAEAFNAAVFVALEAVVSQAQTLVQAPAWLPTPHNRRFRQAMATIDRTVYAAIDAHRRRPEPADGGDLLAMLLSARDEATGDAMSDRQVRDEVVTLIIAGYETVASALTWTWHLLAQHPEAEAALHAEAAAVLGRRAAAADDLARLPIARQVFEEAMRLYPPAWVISRRTVAADTIGGYLIPADALLIMSPYLLHRRPDVWPDPERFRPERHTPEQAQSRPRCAYLPFGAGPRLCIGNHFALTEGQLVVASLAARFQLRPAPRQLPLQLDAGVTLRPHGGLWMTVRSWASG